MLGNRETFRQTIEVVEQWIPSAAHGHESDFQKELQTHLDEQLNSGGLLAGQGDDYVVSREHGKNRVDIAVNDAVGIEMKRDLTNSQTKTLRGQIENYLDEFDFVIVCACGISDMDGWRDLKNKYQGNVGLGIEGGEVEFIHKRKENYGKDPRDVGRSGGLSDLL